jgi:hypothetical protein
MLFWSCSHPLVLCGFGQFLRFIFGTGVHYFFSSLRFFSLQAFEQDYHVVSVWVWEEDEQRFMLWIGYNFGLLHDLFVFFHADGAYLSICYLCYLGIA